MTKNQAPRMSTQQDRPAKDKILALIRQHGRMTATQIGTITGTGHRCARAHLRLLQAYGEVFTVKGTSPIEFSVVSPDAPEAPPADCFDVPVTRTLVPVGQWRVDHPTSPNSVFELGAV